MKETRKFGIWREGDDIHIRLSNPESLVTLAITIVILIATLFYNILVSIVNLLFGITNLNKKKIARNFDDMYRPDDIGFSIKNEPIVTGAGSKFKFVHTILINPRSVDNSHSIENQAGVFLGELGASQTLFNLQDSESDAINVWLFDKEDFHQTYNAYIIYGDIEDYPKLTNGKKSTPTVLDISKEENRELVLSSKTLKCVVRVEEFTFYPKNQRVPGDNIESIKLSFTVTLLST